MHTFSETGAGVPAFLAKLWRLVEDPETNHLIYWNKDGRSFIIQNQAQFARELLPLNYKHNNMASFIRQLNMYGFHKITSIDNGGLKFDRDEMEFSHPCFKRGHPYLLEHIKRKIATAKTTIDDKGLMKPEAVNKVLNEVKAMRGRQDSLDSRFSVMKQENEALWREIASLRQKHMKQQQIVNKLIQFLVTIVQPSRSNMSGVKRHFQLMINDAPQSSKIRKKSESDSGPVIHELTEELLDEVADSDAELLVSTSPNVLSPCDVSNPMGPDLTDEPLNNTDESSSSPVCDRPKSNQSTLSNNHDELSSSSSSNPTIGRMTTVIGSNDVVYHVNEVPDNVELDNNFIEENVLNTPMVKKEMARVQHKDRFIKQLKKQRDRKHKTIQAGILRGQKNKETAGIFRSVNQQQNIIGGNRNDGGIPTMKIKTEKEIDPLLFLDCSNDVPSDPSLDPALISPLSTGIQDAATGSIGVSGVEESQQIEGTNEDNEIFGTSGIISTDMPSELFEDSPMIGDINLASGSYNQNIDLKAMGKLNNGNSISPESSKRVEIDSGGGGATAVTDDNREHTAVTEMTASGAANKDQDSEKSMTLAKYNNQKYADDDIMRLSTADDFTSHLDTVQDDLDNLRDILRGDGYSLDANTLLGNSTPANRFILSSPLDGDFIAKLFSESDVLAPYGLTISNENSQDADKKGSELMTYQPQYYADLSDILDVNADPIPKSPGNYEDKNVKSPAPPSSVLNTPYRE